MRRLDTMEASRAPARPAQYRIDGETVTIAQIAARLGVSVAAAQGRMKRLWGASGPVTWERLRGFGKTEAA
jgi:hypothetical protein